MLERHFEKKKSRVLELELTLEHDPLTGFVTWHHYAIYKFTFEKGHRYPLQETLAEGSSRDFPGCQAQQFEAMLAQAVGEYRGFAKALQDGWDPPEGATFRNNWS